MQFSTITIFALASIAAAAPTMKPFSNSTTVQQVATPLKNGVEARAPQTQAPDATPTDYVSAALYNHNLHRANHSSPAITYNHQLAGYAATVAASCNFAHDLSEGGGGYGQNIAAYASSDFTGFTDMLMLEVAISDQWYNGEAALFLPNYYGEPTPDMSNFENWGHFTQIVWRSTTGVGCASQLCSAGTIFDDMDSYFTVCNYEGAGNIDGVYNSNVLQPLGQATYNP